MPNQDPSRLASLCDRYVDELFAHNPATARDSGDHTFDGRMGPVGVAATARRVEQLDTLAAALAEVRPAGVEERVDVITLRHRVALERFHLVDLESTVRDPVGPLFRAADPVPYCLHAYALAADRAEGLQRQLAEVPDWLEAALGELGDVLDDGPRSIAIDAARGMASFFEDELDVELPLPAHPGLRARLLRSAAAAAAACRRYAGAVERRAPRPSPALGEERFLAMLHAQEGVTETAASLRAIADAELAALRARFLDVAAALAPGEDATVAVAWMESDHPDGGSLITEAARSLEGLRAFWRERGVVTVPDGDCEVRPSPPFLRHFSAAFHDPGALADRDLPSTYVVTPVDGMSPADAEAWLRSMNRWLLENIGVHEVFPGHFVHYLHARENPTRMRKVGFVAGFGEGWAHYTEQLAIEHGLAEGRPLLRLSQLQDALLRACRFRATLAIHIEGAPVDDATALFVSMTGVPEFTARREAERATYDPMYLAYTYGKLQILSWRAELERRPGFNLRTFHDTMLASGTPPLAAVRELVLAEGPV